jgi:hypothetical protein
LNTEDWLILRSSLDLSRQPLQLTFPYFPPLSCSVYRNGASDNHVISFFIQMEVINTGTVLLRHFHCISICSPDVTHVTYENGGFHLSYCSTLTRLQPNQSEEPGQLIRWTTEELWLILTSSESDNSPPSSVEAQNAWS